MNTGIKFFMDLVDVEYDQLLAAFSFYSGYQGNNIVYPEIWSGSNSATGYLNKIDGIFYGDGSGFFDGSTLMSLSGQNFELTNDSTFFISYQKLRTGSEILLSSATGSSFNNYQGYCLGVNDANKLYFKYWNPVEGPFTFTYSKTLSDKNLIVVNRTESVLSIGRYNNNDFAYDLEEFNIFENAFQNNSFGSLILGGQPGNINWVNNGIRNFSGYIDKFYFFKNTSFNYRNILTSGFYAVATGYEGFFENICTETGFFSYSGFTYSGQTGILISGFSSGITGVTGYLTGVSGYSYSGITGYSGKYLGIYYDNCGNSQNIYEQVAVSGLISGNTLFTIALTGTTYITGSVETILSGLISGSGLVVTSGQICDSIFNLTGEALYNVNSGYLLNLSYSEISLLSQVKNNSTLEVYYSPYEYQNLEYNVDTKFDSVNNNFYSPNYILDDKNILLFAQGQALSQSGYELIPSGYEIIRQASLDYFITGNQIEINKNFNESNQLFYDFYRNRPNYYVSEVSGYNTGSRILFAKSFPESGLEKAFVFRNGQKLLSGIDYDIKSLILAVGAFTSYSSPTIIANRLVTLNNNMGSVDSTGNFNFTVRCAILDNDKFLIGGQFTTYNGITANRIVRIFANNNQLDTSFSGQLNNGNIYTLLKYKDKYLVGGDFTGINNISQLRISRLNLDGSVDTSFIPAGSGVDSTINSIFTDSQDNIYVAGNFTAYNGMPINRIMKLNNSGILDKTFNAGNIINSSINATCLASNNSIIIGGSFNLINETGFGRIAEMDLNGNIIDNFKSGFNSNVNAISEDKNQNILIGGLFTGYSNNSIRAERFVVLDKNKNISPLYNPTSGFNNNVLKIIVENDNKILIGGGFLLYKNSIYNRIIRLNSDYTIDTTFIQTGQGFNSIVYDMIPYDAIQLKISGSGGNDIFMAKEHALEFKYISGSEGSLITPQKYNNESSVVFLNGIRQKLNDNYVENSQFDFISGYFFETDYLKDPIYDNTNDFFV